MPYINSESRVGLRRYSKNLELAGQGYILFGVWSVVKLFMMITMSEDIMNNMMVSVNVDLSERIIVWATYATAGVMSLIVLLIHLYIGKGAIRYSRGNRRRKGFLILGAVIALILILDIPMYFAPASGVSTTPGASVIVSILVDMTVVFIYIDMLYSTFMINKFLREVSGEESADAG